MIESYNINIVYLNPPPPNVNNFVPEVSASKLKDGILQILDDIGSTLQHPPRKYLTPCRGRCGVQVV
jgi:hypothetical protein